MSKANDYVKRLVVLYEDNHILVVIKEKNVLSQKDATGDVDMTEIIKTYLKQKYQKPGNVYVGLVHRLDRRVGGVMVFAKTSKASARLSEAIREHRFEKTYLACVEGYVQDNQTIELSLVKENEKARVTDEGKSSSLSFQVMHATPSQSYLLVDLMTGRYQQIRATLSFIGHPIVNDYKYDATKTKEDDLGLWCYSLAFEHPVTHKHLSFTQFPDGSLWEPCKIKMQP